jgi:hypothetical protein
MTLIKAVTTKLPTPVYVAEILILSFLIHVISGIVT